jgi:aspartate aminotransferase
LEALAQVLVEKQVPILSDEVYEALVYGQPFASLVSLGPEVYDLTIIAHAVSKTYAMTGWRIGCAAGPPDVIAAASRLQSHSTSGANSVAQRAALAAIRGDQTTVEEMRQQFGRRRLYMHQRLTAMPGVTCPEPQGAFYAFPRVSEYFGKSYDGPAIGGSMDFCGMLLEHAKLALVPGVAFGNDEHVRLSYAASMEQIEDAMDRMEWFLSRLE